MGCRSTEEVIEEEAKDKEATEEITEEEAKTKALSKEEETIDTFGP